MLRLALPGTYHIVVVSTVCLSRSSIFAAIPFRTKNIMQYCPPYGYLLFGWKCHSNLYYSVIVCVYVCVCVCQGINLNTLWKCTNLWVFVEEELVIMCDAVSFFPTFRLTGWLWGWKLSHCCSSTVCLSSHNLRRYCVRLRISAVCPPLASVFGWKWHKRREIIDSENG